MIQTLRTTSPAKLLARLQLLHTIGYLGARVSQALEARQRVFRRRSSCFVVGLDTDCPHSGVAFLSRVHFGGLILGPSSITTHSLYAESVNSQWVRLLDLLDMNVRYERCQGVELCAEDGSRYLDFLSGYCVHNTGHNHPHIIEALKQELDRSGPAMLQNHVPEVAGELGQRLCALAGGGLTKAFFCSSGSEGIEAAIKFVRATTKRAGLLYCEGAFHGLTCGALSLMDNPFWSDGFGPLLADTRAVPFDDLATLEEHLKTRKYAAFFVEPVQSEGGIRVPAPQYLKGAQELCRQYGTLLVLDEVQT